MPNSTPGQLEEAPIGILPNLAEIYEDTLFVIEFQGRAYHITGRVMLDAVKDAASDYVGGSDQAAEAARKAAEDAAEAAKDAQEALETIRGLIGSGGTSGGSGSAVSLPIASANTLGGVKVGKGLSIASDGTLSLTVNLDDVVTIPGGGHIVLVGDGWGNAPYEIEMSKSDSGPTEPPQPTECVVTLGIKSSDGGAYGGSLTGAGEYASGESCTVVFSPESGYTFIGWEKEGEIVSTNLSYTFTVIEDVTLWAVVQMVSVTPPQPTTNYTVSLIVDPSGSGTTTGGGSYASGSSATVVATPASGYTFSGWKKNGTVVSTSASYTFTVNANVSLTAVFAADITTFDWQVGINQIDAAGVVFGNNIFVAVLALISGFYTSSTGVNWNGGNLPAAVRPTDVAFGNGTFVTLGYPDENGYATGVLEVYAGYSYDGQNWNESKVSTGTTSEYDAFNGITFGANKFVAVGNRSRIAYSSSGVSWTVITAVSTNYQLRGIAYGADKFVVSIADSLSSSGSTASKVNKALYSTNGTTWSTATLPVTDNWSGPAFGNGMFLMVGASGAVLKSTNGTSWSKVAELDVETGYVDNIVFVNDRFLIIGETSVFTSTDGTTWEESDTPFASNYRNTDATYGAGKYVVTNNDGIAYANA